MKADSSSKTDVISEKNSPTLYDLVEDIIKSSLPIALRNHNLIVNEIPEYLPVKTDRNILSSIIYGVVNSVMMHSKNSYIRITAKVYSDIVLVHVKDFNVMLTQGQYYGLQNLHALAKRIGGFIGITSYRHHETTIAFSFPNLEKAFRPVKETAVAEHN